MNAEIIERHNQDERDANKVQSIVAHPLDIPSLERQLWYSDEFGDEPFLSDGYQWRDKPQRVIDKAITEIRLLRAFIANAELTHPDPKP
jgi:hypothetical protein